MLPSRGLRWSRQTTAIARGRLELLSARHCSSLGRNASVRSSPLLPRKGTSPSSLYTGNSLSRTAPSIRNAAGIRFASTAPASAATSLPAAATPPQAGSTVPPAEIVPSSLDTATDLMPESLYDIPVHIGYLKSLGLDYGWGPTSCMEWLIEHIHVYAGTPWWATIAIAAVAIRAVLFKAFVSAADNAARMQAVKPITDPLTKKMMAARGDQIAVLQLRAEIQTINRRAGVKIWRSLVPMVQIFTGYGTFVLLRAMAHLPVPGMENGGALWFHNLTVADPYFILPVSTALALHWVLRKGGETGSTSASPRAMKIMQVALPTITLAVTGFMPAAVQISFFVSGILSLGQASLFRRRWFRSFFNMYPLPSRTGAKTSNPTPSQGTLNVRAPLTQAELNQTYQQRRSSAATATPTRDGKITKFVKGTVQGAATDIKTTFTDVTKSAREIVGQGKDNLSERQAKADRAAAAAYEEKRKKEIAIERRERDEERRARRAAKQPKRSR